MVSLSAAGKRNNQLDSLATESKEVTQERALWCGRHFVRTSVPSPLSFLLPTLP